MGNQVIGIIGDGQLAQMLIYAGSKYDVKFNVLPVNGNREDSICANIATIVDSYEELFESSDVVTYEYEHIDIPYLLDKKYNTIPSLNCLEIIQDKSKQKAHYELNGFKVPESIMIGTGEELLNALKKIYNRLDDKISNYVIKSALSGYNGSGVNVLKDEYIWTDIVNLVNLETKYILEEKIVIKDEVGVMVVINGSEYHVYEPVYMRLECEQLVYLKTPLHKEIIHLNDKIKDMALKIAQSYKTNGLFGIELFIDKKDEIHINEVSPRPHNSGHHTMDNCKMSQYDALIRVLTCSKLVKSEINIEKPCCMMNLFGNDFKGHYNLDLNIIKEFRTSGFNVHLYNKKINTPYRKMGHITKLLTPEESNGKYIYYDSNIIKQLYLPVYVNIVMGSISDGLVVKKVSDLLDKLGVGYSKQIMSAHRMPKQMFRYALKTKQNCTKVIIACAGGAAHLPGMIASLTTKPVIGLPVKTTALSGVDSLYSIVQMPRGVPVATVGIDNGENAALLACRILALSDPELNDRLIKYQEKMENDAINSNQLLC
jgi:phosphoribosylaminoimidazole carboxylase